MLARISGLLVCEGGELTLVKLLHFTDVLRRKLVQLPVSAKNLPLLTSDLLLHYNSQLFLHLRCRASDALLLVRVTLLHQVPVMRMQVFLLPIYFLRFSVFKPVLQDFPLLFPDLGDDGCP